MAARNNGIVYAKDDLQNKATRHLRNLRAGMRTQDFEQPITNKQMNAITRPLCMIAKWLSKANCREYGSFIVTEGVVDDILKCMKHSNIDVRKCAMSAFVNCFIHFSVLKSLVINADAELFDADAELFDALVMVTYDDPENIFGPGRFSKAVSALSIFVEMSTDGASLLNEAVKRSAQLRHVQPYSHLVDLLRNNSYALSAFRLLECAMRRAPSLDTVMRRALEVPTINEMVNLLKACHIELALDAMETLECIKQYPGFSLFIARFRMAFDVNVENAKVGECQVFRGRKSSLTGELEEIKPYHRLEEIEEKIATTVSSVNILHMEREKSVEVLLAQKEIIQKVRGMRCFYQYFQGAINGYMSAWQCIGSDLTKPADDNKSKTANVCGRDIQAGELVSLPGVNAGAITFAKNARKWHRKGVAKKIMFNTSIIATKAGDMNAINEACARGLALRYEDQLNKLTARDAQSLGTFGAMLVLESLRCGTFNVVEDSVSQKDIISVSVEVKERTKSDKCIVPKSKKITITRSDEELVWDQIGVFTKPGIKVNDILYDGNHTDSSLYGYRVGSLSEVKDMGLTMTSPGQSCGEDLSEKTSTLEIMSPLTVDESIGTIESTGNVVESTGTIGRNSGITAIPTEPVHEILEISPCRGPPVNPSHTVDTEGFKKFNKDIGELDNLDVKCDEEISKLNVVEQI